MAGQGPAPTGIRTFLLTAFTAALSLLAACAVSLTVPRDFVFPDYSGETRIPLTAGLRLDDGLRTLTLPACTWMPVCQGKQRKVGDVTVEHFGGEIAIGGALTRGSEGMAASLFRTLVPADPLMAEWANLKGKVDVVIHPKVVKVASWLDHERGLGVFAARITVRWEVFSYSGRLIYSNIATGEAAEQAGPWEADREEKLAALYARALADQFVKAREDLYGSGWWKKKWWEEGT